MFYSRKMLVFWKTADVETCLVDMYLVTCCDLFIMLAACSVVVSQ